MSAKIQTFKFCVCLYQGNYKKTLGTGGKTGFHQLDQGYNFSPKLSHVCDNNNIYP